MSKPGSRRSEYAADLERRRRPGQAAMTQAARELEQERGPAPAETPARPEITLPAEEGHPHGQLVVAFNPATGAAWGFNWIVYPWEEDDSIRDMAARLDAFCRNDPWPGDERGYLEFTSPHDGRIHCLTREGARRVLAVDHARTMGQVAPHSDQVALVRMSPSLLVPPGMTHRR